MNDELKKVQIETAELRRRIGKIEDYLRGKSVPDQFVEYRGVYFKVKAAGVYHEAVFCPSCLQVMLNTETGLFICKPCGNRSVMFEHKKIGDILREVGRAA